MRDGEIRQVGTPEELFSQPAHLDVAEFMGFRNVVAGQVDDGRGRHGRDRRSAAPASGVAAAARSRPGGQAIVAIRPEDLHPVADGANGLRATVVSTEFRGREFVGFGAHGGRHGHLLPRP